MDTEMRHRPARRLDHRPALRLVREPASLTDATGLLQRGVFVTPYLGPNGRPNYISITSGQTKLEERELPLGLSVPELKIEMERLLDELNPQPGRIVRAV